MLFLKQRPTVSESIPAAELDHMAEQKARILAAAREREQGRPTATAEPVDRGGAEPAHAAADPVAQANLYDRLVKRFGWGDRPESRKKFYESLVKLTSIRGQVILDIISTAAARAVSARQPGRYFCSVVKVLFAEKGIRFEPEPVKADW